MGTWDDHDYGKNDVGAEWEIKKTSQQLFLDFMQVDKEDPRRLQEGIYTSRIFSTEKGSVKVIIVDTRYFRSPLRKNELHEEKRYFPYEEDNKEVTLLGREQWVWLERELQSSTADFTVIVSSIQFLSSEHGWETWGNFPNEVKRLQNFIVSNKINNVIILSGDRHISEFSRINLRGLSYPLIDFTSSGLTHSYVAYSGESNMHRIHDVIYMPSFGILQFNFEEKTVHMQMRGVRNMIFQEHIQQYVKNQ